MSDVQFRSQWLELSGIALSLHQAYMKLKLFLKLIKIIFQL